MYALITNWIYALITNWRSLEHIGTNWKKNIQSKVHLPSSDGLVYLWNYFCNWNVWTVQIYFTYPILWLKKCTLFKSIQSWSSLHTPTCPLTPDTDGRLLMMINVTAVPSGSDPTHWVSQKCSQCDTFRLLSGAASLFIPNVLYL